MNRAEGLKEVCSQLLGCIMSSADGGKLMGQAINFGCVETWFTAGWQSALWRALVDLYVSGKPPNFLEVFPKAHEHGAGFSTQDVYECMDQATVLYLFGDKLTYLRNVSLLDRGRLAVMQASEDIEKATPDKASEVISAAQYAIMSIDSADEKDEHPADTATAQIKNWMDVELSDRDGLHWPIRDIDRIVGPLTDEYVFISSKPSVGKTAMALNILASSAWHGDRVSYASLESPRSKIAQRLITIVTGENANALKFKRALAGKYIHAMERMAEFKKKPSGWTFTARTPEQLFAWARMEKQKGSRAILIDNMKHIHYQADSTVEQFRELSLKLKDIRDRLQLPVVVLHHLNDDGKVSWSRDIERDADIQISLAYADDNLAGDTRLVDFICEKNRDGMTGSVRLIFDKVHQSFAAEGGT